MSVFTDLLFGVYCKQKDNNNVFLQINKLKPSQVLIDHYLLCKTLYGEPSKKSFTANLFKLTHSCSLTFEHGLLDGPLTRCLHRPTEGVRVDGVLNI